MKITCGTCGAVVDSGGAPHVCATDVTVARRDLTLTGMRAPSAPPPPYAESEPQWTPAPTAEFSQPASIDTVATSRTRLGALPWFVAGIGAVLIVASIVVLLTRSGGDDAASSVATAPSSQPGSETQPPLVAAAPAVTPAVTTAVTEETAPPTVPPVATVAPAPASADPPTVLLPSSTWNGRYSDEPFAGPLFIGHQGRRVEALQRALLTQGYLAPPVDGDYGPGTESAVIQFQQDVGLSVTGIAGADTLTALGL